MAQNTALTVSCIGRSSFVRDIAWAALMPGDMALDGPYFNEFLLNVICAHVREKRVRS